MYPYNMLIWFHFLCQIYVGGEENNQSKIDNLNENSRLAFFLLIQLQVPYLLENFTQNIKYEKVIDAIIYLYNEELAKSDVVKKQNSYSIQDIKNVVQGVIYTCMFIFFSIRWAKCGEKIYVYTFTYLYCYSPYSCKTYEEIYKMGILNISVGWI